MEQHVKSLIHHGQMKFILEMQGWFNTGKSINLIHCINRIKDKNYRSITINEEKASENMQYIFIIKILNKLGIERMHFNVI